MTGDDNNSLKQEVVRMIAMRLRSLATMMVTAVLAVLAVAAVLAHPAAANIPGNSGVSCFQDGCNYQDAAATGCDADAQTLGRAPIGNLGYVELRWSPTCQTNWARVVSTSGPSSPSHVLDAEIDRQSPIGASELDTEGGYSVAFPGGGAGGNSGPVYHGVSSLYTDMLYSPGPAKAIGVINGVKGTYSQF
jgi:hypothetical protein